MESKKKNFTDGNMGISSLSLNNYKESRTLNQLCENFVSCVSHRDYDYKEINQIEISIEMDVT